MAQFSSMVEAETRAYAKRADGTWINAHAARTVAGVICVRVQRKMSPLAPGAGGWAELTDNAAV